MAPRHRQHVPALAAARDVWEAVRDALVVRERNRNRRQTWIICLRRSKITKGQVYCVHAQGAMAAWGPAQDVKVAQGLNNY